MNFLKEKGHSIEWKITLLSIGGALVSFVCIMCVFLFTVYSTEKKLSVWFPHLKNNLSWEITEHISKSKKRIYVNHVIADGVTLDLNVRKCMDDAQLIAESMTNYMKYPKRYKRNYDFIFDEVKDKDKNVSRQQAQLADRVQENIYEYNVEKTKRRLRKFNDKFNNGRSEILDSMAIGQQATHMHHIFPKHEFPKIADFVENLIALTAGQHLQKAHPAGNTQVIDKDYQYTCLISKTESIRKNLVDGIGEPLYDFLSFMIVLDTGLSTDFFEALPENDFIQVASGIDINFPHK